MDYMEINKGSGLDPAKLPKRSDEKVAIQYRYCNNTLDLSQITFKASLKRHHYQENECWLNAIQDHYAKTLLNPDKTRNRITRNDILTMLDRTEETIKDGLR